VLEPRGVDLDVNRPISGTGFEPPSRLSQRFRIGLSQNVRSYLSIILSIMKSVICPT